jgi:hypothetical protein
LARRLAAGGFGEGLGWADADADRDAGPLPHRAADMGGERRHGIIGKAGEIEESFVDGIDFNRWGELLKRLHYPLAHVAVERVVARKHRDAVAGDLRLYLEIRIAHLEAEGFGLVAAGDDAAVVIRENDDGTGADRGVKHPLA